MTTTHTPTATTVDDLRFDFLLAGVQLSTARDAFDRSPNAQRVDALDQARADMDAILDQYLTLRAGAR